MKSPLRWCRKSGEWFDGPLAAERRDLQRRCGAGGAGDGRRLRYIGSAFIATQRRVRAEGYKQMIVDSSSDDIVYSNLFTGVHGNYLKPPCAPPGSTPKPCPKATRAR